MHSTFLLSFTLAFAGLTFSQEQYSIDPNSVSLSLRQTWCSSQTRQCPLLCLQMPGNSATTSSNTCDPKTLTYSCVCASGGSPNETEYSETLPFFICQEWGNQCVADCGQDNACSNDCRANHPCGAQSPTRQNSSTITSTMGPTGSGSANSASATGTAAYTGFGGAAATTTAAGGNKGAATTAMNLGQSYSLAVVFAGLFAGFAMVL
ncbi:uncharacterized protein K441DRAFT_662470 [Cenococcum geophilum 1.58]|uniref:uncharacterized protein n=1 Tax=Cenococcum geophilum 1.58 TaxID=794803 RepID=UPI00358E94AC|nr:hypothetical protein K441DRAFT_662470 [Cenococcum geophilum 1.58]